MGLALFVWLAPLLASSSPVYWHEDIDINGGRYRYQRFVIGVLIEERVEETDRSEKAAALIALGDMPWVRHGTLNQINRALQTNRAVVPVFNGRWGLVFDPRPHPAFPGQIHENADMEFPRLGSYRQG